MIRRLGALAWITVRFALRSHGVATMLVLLGVIAVATPATLEGDGSIAGQVQLHLTYSLGLTMVTLSAATLWAGSAAISREVAARTLHAVVTKPVHRVEIWAGTWIGLMALNLVLLASAGAAVYAVTQWRLAKTDWTDEEQVALREEILVARRRVSPTHPDLKAAAKRLLEDRDRVDPGEGRGAEKWALHDAEASLLRRRYTAASGETVEWTFRLRRPPPEDRPLQLRFEFDASNLAAHPVAGEWRIGGAASPRVVQQPALHPPRAPSTLRAPADTVAADGSLRVRFTNRNPDPVTIVFDPDSGLALFVGAGSFEGNYVRALLALFCHLGLLAAIGLTAGSLFSFPVAAFLSLAAVILLHSAPTLTVVAQGYASGLTASAGGAPSPLDAWVSVVYRALRFAVAPLDAPNPLDALGRGQSIPWREVAGVFLVKVALYGGGIGCLGSWMFSRRELGDAP